MPKLTTGLYLGLALILSSVIFGSYFFASRAQKDTLNVTGYAALHRQADTVKWSFQLEQKVGLTGVKDGYKALASDLGFVTETLTSKFKIEKANILVSPVNVTDSYEDNRITGYNITQNIQVIAKGEALDQISNYSLNPSDFLDKNIIFRSSSLEFTISDISKIKRELLAQATDDAKQRAKAIAKSSKNRIGKLESLRAGIFQITEPLSTEVSDSGIYNTGTKDKSISVTVNANFYLH